MVLRILLALYKHRSTEKRMTEETYKTNLRLKTSLYDLERDLFETSSLYRLWL
jgi:hypothetical protein